MCFFKLSGIVPLQCKHHRHIYTATTDVPHILLLKTMNIVDRSERKGFWLVTLASFFALIRAVIGPEN